MATEEPKAPKSGRWQFSLRMLLGAVAFVALGCVALFNASQNWQIFICTATFAILFIAMLGGLFRRGGVQAFWAGFAVTGWLYLVLVYGFLEVENQREKPRLATTRALVFVWHAVKDETRQALQPTPINPNVSSAPFILPRPTRNPTSVGPYLSTRIATPFNAGMVRQQFPLRDSFMNIGQYLWAFLLAFLGGLLARYFYRARTDES